MFQLLEDGTEEVTDKETLKAFDTYRNKKILSQSMMDVALFSANANQLRRLLETFDGQYISHVSLILLSTSIILQVIRLNLNYFLIYTSILVVCIIVLLKLFLLDFGWRNYALEYSVQCN